LTKKLKLHYDLGVVNNINKQQGDIMLKGLFAVLVSLFAVSANAGYEIQISNSHVNTGANITMTDPGFDADSVTSFGLNAEVYFGMSEQLQVGGGFLYADSGEDGADATLGLAGLVRYNLSSELRTAMFVGGGVSYADFGDADRIAIHAQVGKRYAISDTLTWTPNLSIAFNMAGDIDEGSTIALNLISFSGFME
jgi:hypothetical protein